MDIVVNKCFGGFSLSKKAVKMLAEKKGKRAYFFETRFGGPRKPITDLETKRGMDFFEAFSVPNPDEILGDRPWAEMSDDERKIQNQLHESISLDTRPEDRTDKDLVDVVKELGDEASGPCAKLEVISIPDGIDWVIDEYDGRESVHEKHRSW